MIQGVIISTKNANGLV